VSQAGAIAQWREMGVQFQDIEDGDDDEECGARNGTTVSIDEDVELLHPNCTVVSFPVVGEPDAVEEQPVEEPDDGTGHAAHEETTALAREAAGQQ